MSDCEVLGCPLCEAITARGQMEFSNQILFETENFAIIPSIGPLALGHMLIICKSHTERLSSITISQMKEFKTIINKIAHQNGYNENFLFIEHGSYEGQKGGACVEHAHVHVIPEFEEHFNVLDGVLHLESDFDNLESLLRVDFPYILSFNAKGGFRIYEAYNAHSQMMRSAICVKLGLLEHDWRKYANTELIKQSIVHWESKILKDEI